MPRGTHPNSLANLKKGKKFTAADDLLRKKAVEARNERRMIADEMKALLDTPDKNGNSRRMALAAKLVLNMDKSPEWYKLGLKMLGEMPAEKAEIKLVDDPLQAYLEQVKNA